MCRGIHACGAHTTAHSRERGGQGEFGQYLPCFAVPFLTFVENRLHKILRHAEFLDIVTAPLDYVA